MPRSPLGQVGRPFWPTPGGSEDSMLALVPADCRLIHVVPGELVQDQQRREHGELVERRSQRMDVVEHTARNDSAERAGVVQLLQRDLPVERPFGRVRIDREDVVARRGKLWGDSSLAATADLEDPPWRFG